MKADAILISFRDEIILLSNFRRNGRERKVTRVPPPHHPRQPSRSLLQLWRCPAWQQQHRWYVFFTQLTSSFSCSYFFRDSWEQRPGADQLLRRLVSLLEHASSNLGRGSRQGGRPAAWGEGGAWEGGLWQGGLAWAKVSHHQVPNHQVRPARGGGEERISRTTISRSFPRLCPSTSQGSNWGAE